MARLECCHETETAIFAARTNLPVSYFQTWQVWRMPILHQYHTVIERYAHAHPASTSHSHREVCACPSCINITQSSRGMRMPILHQYHTVIERYACPSCINITQSSRGMRMPILHQYHTVIERYAHAHPASISQSSRGMRMPILHQYHTVIERYVHAHAHPASIYNRKSSHSNDRRMMASTVHLTIGNGYQLKFK